MTSTELKNWREKAGLTRAELGNRLKVSARTIEAWEQESRQRAIPEREAERIRDLMRQDVLKIPVNPELRAKLERLAKERGVDPTQWAADLLKAALLIIIVTFLTWHHHRTDRWTTDALAKSATAGLSALTSLR